MNNHSIRYRSRLPASAPTAFAWHCQPDAFERLMPPWQRVDIISKQGTIQAGDGIELRLWLGPIPIYWQLVHREYIPNRLFTDEQVQGPFSSWVHRHRFHPESSESCILEDEISYRLPLDWLTHPLLSSLIKRNFRKLFRYRHRVTQDALGDSRWSC